VWRSVALAAALCLAAGVTLAAKRAPGITRRERAMGIGEVESVQLPNPRTWVKVAPRVPRKLNGIGYEAPEVRGWGFYGRTRDRAAWLLCCQDPDGTVVYSDERQVLVIDPSEARLSQAPKLHWSFFRTGMVLDFGGLLLFETSSSDWQFFWINVGKAPPKPQELYRADLEDGFVRLKFGEDDRWTIASGTWGLKQYGGGMPTNEKEAKNAGYRRALNAFTLLGQDGEVCYGRESWINLQAELRFFFGRPDSYAKRDTLVETRLGGEPVYKDKEAIFQSNQIREYPETDLFIVQGAPGDFRASFGWSAEKRRFQLRRQDPGEERWRVLREWDERPLFSNWVRIGLGVSRGCRLLPFLDGEQMGAYAQKCVVRGPIAVLSGPSGKAEVDDIAVWSYPRPADLGTPVFEQSSNFAQKELLEMKDKQTGQWTRSELTFEDDQAELRGRDMHLIRCQFPLYGDFTYTAGPDVPPGEYCVAVVNHQERPYYLGFLEKTAKGWKTDRGAPDTGLQIGRRKSHIVRCVRGEWELLCTRQVSSTVWLVIGAKDEAALAVSNHQIHSKRLTHEFFEKGASDWAWREGNYRMDVRWPCQRGWNFMVAKSRDVAVMYGKEALSGDQEIDFYVSLRFASKTGWYVLRDMGFAFCTDGRSLASGYALVYGDKDNKATTLLRNGKPVCQSKDQIKHRPGGNIHNYWWHGKVCKHKNRITVEVDDRLIFDYTDRLPLKGGHVAFWTFRNSISLAKVSINAERRESRPELFRCPADPPPKAPWEVLNQDEVELRQLPSGRWKATSRVGGGTFALRHVFGGDGIDLKQNPWVMIPVQCGKGTRVGLHLQISGNSYYYPLNAPVKGLRYMLTPAYDTADPDIVFKQRELTEEQLKPLLAPGRHNSREVTLDFREFARVRKRARLESVTVGNSSNHEYLLLGAQGNAPGSAYMVGKPKWKK